MLTTDHPDDERLSAHAAGETDAPDHSSLTLHLAVCARCQGVVRDLRGLRMALSEMPDVEPRRPLQLLPAAEDKTPTAADRLADWARRLFAPALTAGAALAMVGLVGTTLPTLSGMGGQASSASDEAAITFLAEESDAVGQALPLTSDDARAVEGGADLSSPGAALEYGGTARDQADAESSLDPLAAEPDEAAPTSGAVAAEAEDAEGTSEDGAGRLGGAPAERSPWPMLLFAGVAVMIGAALLRWILVPSAA